MVGLIADDFALIKNEDGETILNEKFVENLKAGRKEAQAQMTKRSALSLTITTYLVAQAFAVESPISIFGISIARISGFNEVLLLISCALIGLSVSPTISFLVQGVALKIAISHVFPSQLLYFYKSSYFPEEAPAYYKPHYIP